MKKQVAVVIVLVLIASLLVCGCMTSTTSNTASPTAAGTAYPAVGTRSALLSAIVAQEDAGNGNRYANDKYTMTWLNDTAIAMHEQASFSGTGTETYDATFIHFPTVDAASAYFNNARLGYTTKSVSEADAYLYAQATGGNATVVKGVWRFDNSTRYQLEQFDALIMQSTRVDKEVNQA
jgi:hypothetical protein